MTWKKRLQFVLGAVMVLIMIVSMLWCLGGWKAMFGAAVTLGCAAWLAVGLYLMNNAASLERNRNCRGKGDSI